MITKRDRLIVLLTIAATMAFYSFGAAIFAEDAPEGSQVKDLAPDAVAAKEAEGSLPDEEELNTKEAPAEEVRADDASGDVSVQENSEEAPAQAETAAEAEETETAPVIAAQGEVKRVTREAKKSGAEKSGAVTDEKSLKDAVANAESGKETVIIIGADITLTSSVSIPSGKSVTIKDDGTVRTIDSKSSVLFNVSGGELTIDATSDENLVLTSPGATSGLINVSGSGVLNLKSGTITGNTLKYDYCGTISVGSSATFNMTGGKVTNNRHEASWGSAIYVRSSAKFNLSGGEISDNYSARYAGGVMIDDSAVMNMTGGLIARNKAKHSAYDNGDKATGHGGGICVAGFYATLRMTGGRITENKGDHGGGIYTNSRYTYVDGGEIDNNYARVEGGGIYVSTTSRILHISNAVVTENTATMMGGGMWACPTGTSEIYVTDGVALFDNTASSAIGAAGDDLVSIGYPGYATVAERMLGGGKVTWYADGRVANSGVAGAVYYNAPRFDASNPGEPVLLDKSTEAVALKADATPEAKARAKAEAKLLIHHNRSSLGGGIGTNGDMRVTGENKEEWTLKVLKEWIDIPEEDQIEVEVALKIGENELDKVTLNKANEWKAEFTGLPNPDSLSGKIGVVEVTKMDKVETTYGDAEIDEENRTITIKVTNKKKEEPPKEPPTEPEEPPVTPPVVEEETEETVDNFFTELPPESGDGETSVTPVPYKAGTPVKKASPDTGDDSSIVYVLILAAAASSLLALAYRRKRASRM